MNQVDNLYVYGLYPWIRLVADTLSWILPLPVILVLLSGGLLWLLLRGRKRLREEQPFSKVLFLKRSLIGLGGAVAFFYLSWGLVYFRASFTQLSGLEAENLADSSIVRAFERQSQHLNLSRRACQDDTVLDWQLRDYFDRPEMESLQQLTGDAFEVLNIQPVGFPRIKAFRPMGFLLHFGTAGFYFPFGGEGYVDPGLHPLQYPFTISHELSHAYGMPGEGECNFIAWLACVRSTDPVTRYSADLAYWRYLAAAAREIDEACYLRIRKGLSPAVQYDLAAIRSYSERYPDWFPRLRDAWYDLYLRINGIAEGERSYGKLVAYIAAWELQYPYKG